MAIKVKLTKSAAGSSVDQLATIASLGLKKFGSERLLQDTPAIRGMVNKVRHLVTAETVQGDAPKATRRKPRKIRARDAARARQASKA
ncbi:50S ribosomal protein L30 [Cystobacter fuscus]|jgi:large subunit ribosomal protein L30|uniref:50S ribosomal protein L30 n=2 Tax=Cystobacter fuscus TaxID=43 RepID=S9P3F8_CYSF2|nr:50S ribosomal protein L30 [Cystobacter fuscus]ATB38769.1 50S ribosomal protein L30 [Cystobacter fuscus]EPX57681.1 LSU ribosomal protein L30p (L7e) [Cystobacter fuscus DSM 2262]WNG16770.1 50S ribosomal protein L30 [Cystobacter fuscus]WNG26330.1 50S ribosomal protein L30 [Cystobacter fuscus]